MSKKTVIHIEDVGKRGGTYLEGDPNDLLLALIGSMQANQFMRILFEKAVFVTRVAEKKGLDFTKNYKIDFDDEAENAYKEFVDPEYKKKSGHCSYNNSRRKRV